MIACSYVFYLYFFYLPLFTLANYHHYLYNNNALRVHWSQMFFCCHNIVFGWRIYWPWLVCIVTCKTKIICGAVVKIMSTFYIYHFVHRHYLFAIYDMIQCLGCTIILVLRFHTTYVFMHTTKFYLFDRHCDRLIRIFFWFCW